MDLREVLDVLDRLDAAGVHWWVHGGWGMDALLGAETRLHDDLDLAVVRSDLPALERALPEFHRMPERDEWPSSLLMADVRGRRLDVHPLRLDDAGNGWQEQRDGSEFQWSKQDLAGCGRMGQRVVRCTSPAFEARSHTYSGHDDVDRSDHERLAARFDLERPAGPWPGFVFLKRIRARTPPSS